ncbi:hypothetical protein ACFFX1_44905 [Dactylosporangium sucinum]|uniref:Uncharacterized protein n=1 Tax=Dactylosporangium sucinum TaxID=1424081 RepID=A0A917X6N3_9ACTN|nr:hypothetical protein [Dactylosporangium sucinum]GGM79897.1 hypothetical protein GCM10007977_096790 [Dactylosporangium sucinum]
MTRTRHEQSAIGTMYAGLGLTVVAMIVPYIARTSLADHIRAGYPTYAQGPVDTAVMTYLIYLTVLGALGIACWFGAIWAVRTGKRWARSVATLVFALGAGIALFNLLVKDTSGDTGLPPLLGWVGVLPCLAGLLVVTLLWRTSRPTSQARQNA